MFLGASSSPIGPPWDPRHPPVQALCPKGGLLCVTDMACSGQGHRSLDWIAGDQKPYSKISEYSQ